MEERYTAEQVIQALALAKGNKTKAAQILGCVRKTIDNYCSRYEDVAEACRQERESMIDLAESRLYTKAIVDGDTTALIFILKTQGKSRGYVERQQIEHSGTIIVDLPEDMR